MDNQQCSVPYSDVNDSFAKPIHQGILGCYSHGSNDFTIYKTTGKLMISANNINSVVKLTLIGADYAGLVSKSANLTVHAILDQIARYRKRLDKFSKKFYLQFDGGAENANHTRWVSCKC